MFEPWTKKFSKFAKKWLHASISFLPLAKTMLPSRVTLYVKTGCPWCAEAEEVLSRRGVSYDRVDVLRDRQALKTMKEISGQSKAPTMEWDDEILADFGGEELDEFLKSHGV